MVEEPGEEVGDRESEFLAKDLGQPMLDFGLGGALDDEVSEKETELTGFIAEDGEIGQRVGGGIQEELHAIVQPVDEGFEELAAEVG